MLTLTLKIFNAYSEVYTREGTISLCQRDASAQVHVISHNHSTQVLNPFRSPPPWSLYDLVITDICQYTICPI